MKKKVGKEEAFIVKKKKYKGRCEKRVCLNVKASARHMMHCRAGWWTFSRKMSALKIWLRVRRGYGIFR